MNYRHAFHAGNFADVLKHAVLALVVEHLRHKEAPFFVLDTHAGIGEYDLGGIAAEKTGEWRDGIGRILYAADPLPALAPYLALVDAPHHYPGSPAVARALMRSQDRMALVELHPEDHAELARRFGGDRRVAVHAMDGYAALKALLPPAERRGVVLIDPPFEVKDEAQRLKAGLAEACRRWRHGIYVVWYPIKGRAPVERMLAEFTMLGLPPTLVAELMIRPGDDPFRLNGSGLAILNPPWKLADILAGLLPWLASTLAPDGGSHRLEWLVPERQD